LPICTTFAASSTDGIDITQSFVDRNAPQLQPGSLTTQAIIGGSNDKFVMARSAAREWLGSMQNQACGLLRAFPMQ
jgi:hypothetical protein